MSGKAFEDQVWLSLEDAVEDDGVVLLRRQSFSARSGHGFQASQVTGDLLVDSPDPELYIGVECKSVNTKYAFYFSNNYNEEQIEKQMEYAERSGRDMFVAVECRDDDESRPGWNEDRAYLFPIELFAYFSNTESKVSYEEMETFGYTLGVDGDYTFDRTALKHARSKADEFSKRLDNLEDN
jgi:Holliday junction resolvase